MGVTMFQVNASGSWFKRPVTRETDNLECAFFMMDKLVARGFKEVYITAVGQRATRGTTMSRAARDRRLTTKVRIPMVKQKVINIRIGEKLLQFVSHYSSELGMSQNAFILEAIQTAIDTSPRPIELIDLGIAMTSKVQYSIRLDEKLLKAVDRAARNVCLTRSTWVLCAIVSHLSRLSSADFQ